MNSRNRKETILRLIKKSNGRMDRLKLFKLGFLLGQEIRGFYEFLPYKYGPYSFEMDRDIRRLLKSGKISENSNELQLKTIKQKTIKLDKELNYKINNILNKYGNLDTGEILKYVYSKYSYFRQFSHLGMYPNVKSKIAPIFIYTIGYQNLSIDEFINILVKKGIKFVLDVRNTPFSYKYGFSKSWLTKYLPEFNIEYANMPELGIPEIYRKSLNDNALWEKYREILKSSGTYINDVMRTLKRKPTVLICFEANPEECHRYILAKELSKKTKLKIVHYSQESKYWI